MNEADLLASLGDRVIVVALSTVRIAIAFLIMPLFARDSIPPLVRNAIFMSMAVVGVAVQPAGDVSAITSSAWANLVIKEAMIGLAIGLLFGLFLWAFESAGVIIDFQIGVSFALFFDPIIGNEATLFGTLFSRFANYLFLIAGGMMLMVGALIESFAVWPLLEPLDGLREASVRLFEAELSRFMSLTARIAGPIMLVLFLIDVGLGLINRYAPQFNVFFLSMSIKALSATLLVIILLPFLVDVLLGELAFQAGRVDDYLARVFSARP